MRVGIAVELGTKTQLFVVSVTILYGPLVRKCACTMSTMTTHVKRFSPQPHSLRVLFRVVHNHIRLSLSSKAPHGRHLTPFQLATRRAHRAENGTRQPTAAAATLTSARTGAEHE